jgi:hypothetical protein
MAIIWDSLEVLKANDEFQTAIIEGITIFAALSVVFVLFYLKSKYPKMTKKGFTELIIGFLIFAGHFLFDLLDTLVQKKVNGLTVQAYYTFDILDAVLSFIGLFIIVFAFIRIANYGMELWEGKEK